MSFTLFIRYVIKYYLTYVNQNNNIQTKQFCGITKNCLLSILHELMLIIVLDTNSIVTKPSLRYTVEDDGHDHNFIQVTPEFQEFVAKHLSKHLER